MSPGAIDSLSEFAGIYTTFFKDNEGQAPRPAELTIAASKSGEAQPCTIPGFCVSIQLSEA